jgi:hypothetical protein
MAGGRLGDGGMGQVYLAEQGWAGLLGPPGGQLLHGAGDDMALKLPESFTRGNGTAGTGLSRNSHCRF